METQRERDKKRDPEGEEVRGTGRQIYKGRDREPGEGQRETGRETGRGRRKRRGKGEGERQA